ncbi:VWA domain-containing protein, partial [Frankia sp. Cpl3]|nr:VWA domain-containing protein [Frankia sp. Cpl3]
QQPYFLLLLAPAFYFVIHWWRKQTRMRTARRTVIAVLRTLIFTLLIFALAGTQLLYPVQAETIIFVVDRSASMKDDARVASFVQNAIDNKPAVDQYGIVSVGQTAGVEQPITTKAELTPFGLEVGKHATNLAEGIRLATGMIPSTARGKIVVLSDGLATHGDAATQMALAKERGIAVQAVSLQQPMGEEVVLTSVQLPGQLYLGEDFTITADVESTVATKATLRLYEGNQEVGQRTVTVEKGKNRFLLPEKSRQEGFQRYRVEIQPQKDSIQVNNQAHAFTQVQGTPRVLIIEGHPGAARNLANALQAGKIAVETKAPALLPNELNDYKQYASIILADLDATQIREKDMERMRTAVSDLGIGLIMTGGKNGFGMGGWFKTPVEEALPVYMDLRGKEKLPWLGLELIVDKSGSMEAGMNGGNKMELAKEAAIRATEMLNENDQVGVVAFDGEPWVVVEPKPVTKLTEIQEQIGRIAADGGTDIFPALMVGYEQIKE